MSLSQFCRWPSLQLPELFRSSSVKFPRSPIPIYYNNYLPFRNAALGINLFPLSDFSLAFENGFWFSARRGYRSRIYGSSANATPREEEAAEEVVVMKAKSSGRRFCYRSVIPAVVVAGILLPVFFISSAFLALDAGTTICPTISCLGWRLGPLLFRESDTSLEFGKELRRVYMDADEKGEAMDPKFIEAAPGSLDQLLAEVAAAAASYQHVDIKTFLLKTKAMLIKTDHKVQLSRLQASIYRHLASIGIPKSAHCVTLSMAEEYLVNAVARSSLPLPEYAYRLSNASYIHIAILTDNILAAAVAVSSTVTSSKDPEKFVFHIITDKKTYTAMHAWFALNPVFPAILEVKGLHQFDCAPHMSATVMETVEEIHQGLMAHQNYNGDDQDYRRLEGLSPSSFSLLNYLRIHLPELFPKLQRLILLDDDVVVQHDLSPLWDLDLSGNVIGAVGPGEDRGSHCLGRELDHYFNFSNPFLLSLRLDQDQCAWLGGMNIFNLEAWRRTNITPTFQQMLKLNRESDFALWRLGWLPPALVAFDGKVQAIDPLWNLSELGRRVPEPEAVESAAVLHFSGPRKPWLEIGFPELRKMWLNHLNHSDKFLVSCRVVQ